MYIYMYLTTCTTIHAHVYTYTIHVLHHCNSIERYCTYTCTVEPVYSGHLGTPKNCPDYRGVLISQVLLYTYTCILQWDHN